MRLPAAEPAHCLPVPTQRLSAGKGRSLLLEPTMWAAQQGEAATHSYGNTPYSQDTCLHFLLKCDVGHGQLLRTSGKALKPFTADIPSPAQQGHRATSSGSNPSQLEQVSCQPSSSCLCRNTCSRTVSVDVILRTFSWHELGTMCLRVCAVSHPSSIPSPGNRA